MSIENLGEEFLSIKEFAELVGMTIESLRHYDRKDVFHPAKRGIGFENKYRFYAPTQITTVKMIRTLAEIGVPLQTIKELAQNRTPEKLLKLLSKHKDIVTGQICYLQEVCSIVSTFTELLHSGVSAIEDEVYVSEMPENRILLGGINDFEGSVGFYREFVRFYKAQHEPELNMSYPIGGFWESMEAYLVEPSLPIRFFSLDPKGNERKAAGLYLIAYTRGYYAQTNDLPERMAAFAKKNGLVFNGPVYNIYLFDEMSVADPKQYLLQASASVRETRRVSSRRSYKAT